MRLLRAFVFSLNGFRFAFKSEPAFRLECYVLLATIVGIFFLPISMIETFLLVGSVIFVMIVELLNTAIEKTVDRISTERHDLSKVIKDMGSAAVLLSILIAFFIWGGVGIRHFS